jgi:hypothetical protein
MTDKNIALLRQVLTPGVWSNVVKLPFVMMAEARRQQQHAPTRAAVTAQLAVGIGILSVAPIRIGNLTAVQLGKNLSKPGGPNFTGLAFQLRCQKSTKARISAGAVSHAIDQRICP